MVYFVSRPRPMETPRRTQYMSDEGRVMRDELSLLRAFQNKYSERIQKKIKGESMVNRIPYAENKGMI